MKFLLSLFFFLLPFQWALSPLPGIDLALARPAVIVLFFLWFSFGFLRRKLILPISWASFFMTFFLFWSALSLLWSQDVSFAVRKLLFLFSLVPLFFILLSRFDERPLERLSLLRAFVLGAFLSAATGIIIFFLQFFFGVEKTFTFLMKEILPFFLGESFGQSVAEHQSLLVNISGETFLRASSFFPDPHMFSFYTGMAIPVAAMFYFLSQSKKTTWLVITMTLLLADLLSFSRGGYSGLFFGIGLFLVSIGVKNRWPLKRILIGGITTVCFVFLFLWAPFGSRFLSSFSLQDGSNTERLRLWHEAMLHIAKRPLLGVGLGNYPLVVKPSATYREPIYVHNLYLDIVVELGIIGFGGFILVCSLAFFYASRSWWRQRDPFALTITISLCIFLAHSLFDTALFSVHVLPVILLLLSLGVSCRYRNALP